MYRVSLVVYVWKPLPYDIQGFHLMLEWLSVPNRVDGKHGLQTNIIVCSFSAYHSYVSLKTKSETDCAVQNEWDMAEQIATDHPQLDEFIL